MSKVIMDKNETLVHIEIYSERKEIYLGGYHANANIKANGISHSINIENIGKEKGSETLFEITTSLMLSVQNIEDLHKYIHRLEENV